MTDICPLVPRQPVPSLSVAVADEGIFDLAMQDPNVELTAKRRSVIVAS
jgi:hypothetical protein